MSGSGKSGGARGPSIQEPARRGHYSGVNAGLMRLRKIASTGAIRRKDSFQWLKTK
jgi:hypothetical protein